MWYVFKIRIDSFLCVSQGRVGALWCIDGGGGTTCMGEFPSTTWVLGIFSDSHVGGKYL